MIDAAQCAVSTDGLAPKITVPGREYHQAESNVSMGAGAEIEELSAQFTSSPRVELAWQRVGHHDLRMLSGPSGQGGCRFPARRGGRAGCGHSRRASTVLTKKCAILYR